MRARTAPAAPQPGRMRKSVGFLDAHQAGTENIGTLPRHPEIALVARVLTRRLAGGGGQGCDLTDVRDRLGGGPNLFEGTGRADVFGGKGECRKVPLGRSDQHHHMIDAAGSERRHVPVPARQLQILVRRYRIVRIELIRKQQIKAARLCALIEHVDEPLSLRPNRHGEVGADLERRLPEARLHLPPIVPLIVNLVQRGERVRCGGSGPAGTRVDEGGNQRRIAGERRMLPRRLFLSLVQPRLNAGGELQRSVSARCIESISIDGPRSWAVFSAGSPNCPTATSKATFRAPEGWHINAHSSTTAGES